MFENELKPQTLNDKVLELIKKFKEIKVENENLRTEIVTLKAQNESLNSQLLKLEDNISYRDLNEEDLFNQIQDVLSDLENK